MNSISNFIRKNKNIFVGIFISIPLVIIPIILTVTFIKSDFFKEWENLYVEYDNVFDLSKGNSVNYKGINIGYINNISIAKDGNILVEMKIQKKYNYLIHKKDMASLSQKNFVVGDWEISVVPSKRSDILVEENDTLTAHMPIRIQRTLEQVARLFNVVETFTSYITSGQGLLGQLITNDTLFSTAQNIIVNTNKLVKNANKLISSAKYTIKSTDGMIENFNGFTNKGETSIDSLTTVIGQISNSFDNLNNMIYKFDKSPKEIKKMLNNINSSMQEANILFKGLQGHWLFRKQIKKYKKENGIK